MRRRSRRKSKKKCSQIMVSKFGGLDMSLAIIQRTKTQMTMRNRKIMPIMKI
jgi:hypothetical protein